MNIRNIALIAILAAGSLAATAGQQEDAVLAVINSYRPGSTGYGAMKVENVNINTAKKTITVKCNGTTTYLPLTAERLQSLKKDIAAALGSRYSGYKVTITAGDKNLEDLVLFAPKKNIGPTEKGRFVTDLEAAAAPAGLDNANIAIWQSHGWYFEPKLNRWEWQRARIFQTVEDLYTQSYVMPFLMPMLENAGAYVMSPRERDTNLTEIIIDRDNAATPGYSETDGDKAWTDAGVPGFGWDGANLVNGQHPFSDGGARSVATVRKGGNESYAVWSADIPGA